MNYSSLMILFLGVFLSQGFVSAYADDETTPKPKAKDEKTEEKKETKDYFAALPKDIQEKLSDLKGYPGLNELLSKHPEVVAHVDDKKPLPEAEKFVPALRNLVADQLKRELSEKSPVLKEFMAAFGSHPEFNRVLLQNPEIQALLKDGKAIDDPAKLFIPLMRKMGEVAVGKDGGEGEKRAALPGKTERSALPKDQSDFMGVFKPDPNFKPAPGRPGGTGSHQQGGGGGGGSLGACQPEGGSVNPGTSRRRSGRLGKSDELGSAPFPKDKLMAAGTNNNPAFEIMTHLGPVQGGQAYGRCQATLVAVGMTCAMATATHCTTTKSGDYALRMNTAYGVVNVEEVVSPDDDRNVQSDISLVKFSGDTCKKMKEEKVPVVALSDGPPKEGQTVVGGTRYFGKNIFGKVYSAYPNGKAVSVNYNFLGQDGRSHQGGVHSGDSGGPLLAFNESKNRWELAGVLSASTADSQVHEDEHGNPTIGGTEAFYSTNTGLMKSELAAINRIAAK